MRLKLESNREFSRGSDRECREKGSALIVALLIMVIMTLLGLAFLLVGETEAKIAVNQRDSSRASYAAEGGVRLVKKWFEAPNGSAAYLVPTVAQMNRTLRYVDDDSDGTYQLYSGAPAPWNTTYRQGTDDPFERPYHGAPAKLLLGTEDHPDVRISSTGSAGEQSFLTTLNDSLYPAFPSVGERARIKQVDVYAPPILLISGARVRYGMATIKVTAEIYEQAGTAAEKKLASRVVKAVLSETPYPASGPIQSCANFDSNGNFAAHWGKVTAVTLLDLHSNLDGKVDSGMPWYNANRIISRDMDFDGTLNTSSVNPDNQDGDGNLDWDEWVSGPGMEDPWLRYWSQGDVTSGGKAISPGCSGSDCQPDPWFQSPSSFGSGTNDHSNLVKNVGQNLCPDFDYDFWKTIAQSGVGKTYYYTSDGPGTATYKLNGSGPSLDFRAASDQKVGMLFFETSNNSRPVDANSDGTFENLSADIQLNGGAWTGGGFIYMNANFATTASGGVAYQRELIAPAEPYIDANSNGAYDNDEWFVDLTYPGSYSGSYNVNGMHRVIDGFTRQDPAVDVASAGRWNANINMVGMIYTTGAIDHRGDWMYFGSVITKAGMPTPGITGTPDFYFDERMIKGTWPPADWGLPRTLITAWQTDQ